VQDTSGAGRAVVAGLDAERAAKLDVGLKAELDAGLRRLRAHQQGLRRRATPDDAPEFDRDRTLARLTTIWLDGRPRRGLLILMNTNGCRWYLRAGGCFMCSYSLGARPGLLTADNIKNQFENALAECPGGPPEVVFVYPFSCFDPQEVAPAVIDHICRRLGELDAVRYAFFESRPEFVTADVAGMLRRHLGEKVVHVCMGLESADEFVTRYAVHKGYGFKQYARAAAPLRAAGINAGAFLVLKPPFLTEGQALDDATRSVRAVLETPGAQAFLMCNNVAAASITGELHRLGMYRPPWLWSAVEVARRTPPALRERLHLAGFQGAHQRLQHAVSLGRSAQEPEVVDFVFGATFSYFLDSAANCGKCDAAVAAAIDRYNSLRDFAALEALGCDCRQEWAAEAARTAGQGLAETVLAGYRALLAGLDEENEAARGAAGPGAGAGAGANEGAGRGAGEGGRP